MSLTENIKKRKPLEARGETNTGIEIFKSTEDENIYYLNNNRKQVRVNNKDNNLSEILIVNNETEGNDIIFSSGDKIKFSSNNFIGEITIVSLGAARIYTLPDKSGTFAMLSDVPASLNLGNSNLIADASRTYTLAGDFSTDTLIIENDSNDFIAKFKGDGNTDLALLNLVHSTTAIINFKAAASIGSIQMASSGQLDILPGSSNNCNIRGGGSNAIQTNIDGLLLFDNKNITFSNITGTKIGVAAANKFAFWNTTPVSQPAHIADPAGGATVDAEARTAINAILAWQATIGLTAAS